MRSIIVVNFKCPTTAIVKILQMQKSHVTLKLVQGHLCEKIIGLHKKCQCIHFNSLTTLVTLTSVTLKIGQGNPYAIRRTIVGVSIQCLSATFLKILCWYTCSLSGDILLANVRTTVGGTDRWQDGWTEWRTKQKQYTPPPQTGGA